MTTKLSDSLSPIGGKAKLYTSVAEILRTTNVDVDKATPRVVKLVQRDHVLLTALVHDFASRVAADMRNAERVKTTAAEAPKAEATTTPGHVHDEAQATVAGGHLSAATDAEKAEVVTAPDQFCREAHAATVGGHPSAKTKPAKKSKQQVVHSRGREGPHRRRHDKMPTELQLAAEKAVAQATTLFDTWTVRGGRKIGDLYLHELRTRALDSITIGFSFAMRGKEDIFDGCAEQMIALHVQQHMQVTDPMARVRDVINEATLKRIKSQAGKRADKAIERVNALSREVLAEIAKGEAAQLEQQD